jgi:hypothetical protein
MAGTQQLLDDRGSNEAGGSGNENAHENPFTLNLDALT